MCGSSSTINILPIVDSDSCDSVERLRRDFDRKAYRSRLVTSEYYIAAVRSHDVAGDGEAKPVSALFGGKQRLENATDGLVGNRADRINHFDSKRGTAVP